MRIEGSPATHTTLWEVFMKFKDDYSFLAWEMFKVSGNPYIIQEEITHERSLENDLGK